MTSQLSRDGTLASRGGTWQGEVMARPPSNAGGVLIAVGALGGAGIGFLVGQATPGFLVGVTLGIALTLLLWWRETRR